MVNKVETITIFIIQAYEKLDKATGTVQDLCTLDIIDESVDGAIARAKKLIKKKFYRVSSIIEKELPQPPVYLLDNKNHGTN